MFYSWIHIKSSYNFHKHDNLTHKNIINWIPTQTITDFYSSIAVSSTACLKIWKVLLEGWWDFKNNVIDAYRGSHIVGWMQVNTKAVVQLLNIKPTIFAFSRHKAVFADFEVGLRLDVLAGWGTDFVITKRIK